MWIRAAGGVAVLALAWGGTAGCGGSADTGDAVTPPSASTGMGAAGTPAGTTSPTAAAARPSAGAKPVLADGRSPVYLTGLNTAGKTVTFDLIEFLTGDAAKKQWKKQHPENPDGPDNDYLIVNNNKKLRTLPVAADVKCEVLSVLGDTDTKTVGFASFPAYLKQQNKGINLTPPTIAALPFWLTVRNGVVVKFEEQFLP
jgi:hypothetical protein